ncbi:hypothetical protein SAMN02745866_03004 [Alteromonadaceae bacterium Bs31]|nr:hypothetical protein SAMN02745866_03004 [Alteromonadaceae bacterium Bs31]
MFDCVFFARYMLLTLLLSSLSINLAADNGPSEHSWQVVYTPYGWLASIKTDADVENSPGKP